MEDKLFLDDIEIELGDAQINRTLQINDFRKIEDRQGSYTPTIKVPKTPKNIKSFNYLGILGDQSNKPFEKVKARIISSGVTLVRNGLAMIKSQHRDYYSVFIIDGIVPFWQEIKGKTVRDLDLTNLNHTREEFEIYASGVHTHIDGFRYLTIKTIEGEDDFIMPESFAPFIFVRTIWDKIFQEAGFTYSGVVFDSDDFTRLLVSLEEGFDNNNFKYEETAPTISQQDFIKEFLIRFNLTYKLVGDNHFEFIELEKMLSDRENSIDWSDIFSHKESEVYKIGDYAKENRFFNAKDSLYEYHSFDLSNENLKEEKKVFTSKLTYPFRYSTIHNVNNNLPIDTFECFLWKSEYDEDTDTTSYIPQKSGFIALCYLRDLGYNDNYSYVDHFPSASLSYYISNYYPKFIETIDKPRILTAYFRINIKTLNDVDFFKLVFIKQTGHYYYINKIMNYNSKRPLTKVELIQVN